MKTIGMFIGYNVIAISLLILAGYMMHIHQKGSGWVIGAALLAGIVPKTDDKE